MAADTCAADGAFLSAAIHLSVAIAARTPPTSAALASSVHIAKSHTLISREAAARWRAEREAESARR